MMSSLVGKYLVKESDARTHFDNYRPEECPAVSREHMEDIVPLRIVAVFPEGVLATEATFVTVVAGDGGYESHFNRLKPIKFKNLAGFVIFNSLEDVRCNESVGLKEAIKRAA